MNMKIARLRRVFPDRRLSDPRQTLVDRLQCWWNQRKGLPGQRIAIAAGSRGIDRLPEVTATLVSFLKEQGASPFIVSGDGQPCWSECGSSAATVSGVGNRRADGWGAGLFQHGHRSAWQRSKFPVGHGP